MFFCPVTVALTRLYPAQVAANIKFNFMSGVTVLLGIIEFDSVFLKNDCMHTVNWPWL